jgi:phage shock protein PspC (stress-responsive transcriptional regulator)
MSRPTKLTRETEARLVAGVRAGLTVGIACEIVGISPRTYQRWMASGRPEHRQLREAVQRARAGCEADLVARMHLAALRGSWRAAAYLLERQAPERWGRPPRHGGLKPVAGVLAGPSSIPR